MPQALPVIAAVGAVAGVVGTVQSQRAQKKASAAQQRQQELATRRSRRQAIRQAQIARAQSVASAAATGATGSSAALGGQGSIGSQLGSGLGFSTQMSGLSREISTQTTRAQTGQALAGLGFTAFSAAGGFDSLGKLFPQQKPTSPGAAGSTSGLTNFGSEFGASGITPF